MIVCPYQTRTYHFLPKVTFLTKSHNFKQKSAKSLTEIAFLAGSPQRPLCGSGASGAERRRRNQQQHRNAPSKPPPPAHLRLLKQLLPPSSSSSCPPLLSFISNRDNVGADVDDDLGHRDDDQHAQLGKGDRPLWHGEGSRSRPRQSGRLQNLKAFRKGIKTKRPF